MRGIRIAALTAAAVVTGPVEATDAACWEGPPGSDADCGGVEIREEQTQFHSGSLDPGEGLTIAVAYPPDTFTDIEPILTPGLGSTAGTVEEPDGGGAPGNGDGPSAGDVSDTDGAAGTIAEVTDPVAEVVDRYRVLLVLAAYALGAMWRIRDGRDLHFADLPPGTLPADPEQHPVARLRREPEPVVAFTSPERLRPAEVGYLMRKGHRGEHLSATILDLAARGFLTITEADTDRRGRPNDWELKPTPSAAERQDELSSFEQQLFTDLFAGQNAGLQGSDAQFANVAAQLQAGTLTKEQAAERLCFVDDAPARADTLISSVRMSDLRNHFAASAKRVRGRLLRRTKELGLFEHHPSGLNPRRATSATWQGALTVVLLLLAWAGALWEFLPESATTLLMTAVVALGGWLVVRGLTRSSSFPRSATGRALHDQARGFQRYLETAEAEQIRFEEGIDVFSRYLPYATVFGVAERWAEVFEQLQAQGRYHADTSWYAGTAGMQTSLRGLGTSVSSFSRSASTTLTSTPGSSGGSGFSGGGGGGFSGGGGGGGGGGGR